MMPLAFVDTETTGLHVGKQLWEVAIIRRDFNVGIEYIDGENRIEPMVETRYEAFVRVDTSDADLFGLNVGRYYERHPHGRYLSGRSNTPDQVWDTASVASEVARMTHGARFIGAAPSFDAEVLGDFLRKHGLLPTWHHRLVDTHDLAVGFLRARALEEAGPNDITDWYDIKKDTLSEWLGVKPHNDPKLVHTAMGDAQHEADIWDAILG